MSYADRLFARLDLEESTDEETAKLAGLVLGTASINRASCAAFMKTLNDNDLAELSMALTEECETRGL
jgi:hypothetical protein